MCMSAVLVPCFDIFLVQNRSLHFLAMDEPEELHEHVPLKNKIVDRLYRECQVDKSL